MVIIRLDGMPFGLMRKFAQDGTMPNFGRLTREGTFRQMASSIPEISSVAWSSVITGRNPGAHGIYGFTDIAPGTYRLTFPNFRSLQVAPFWERAGSGRSVIINVPMTFPAREMNGVLIAGFVALDLKRATWPASLLPTLHKMNYRVDVDSQKAHQSLRLFLQDLEETLQARIAAYRYLWQHEKWDTFMLVFTGTDRLAHFLWDAYEDEQHEFHQAFISHFQQIDQVIGEIYRSLRPGDRLLMLSDHGFERVKRNVFINHVLREQGFLSFEEGGPPTLRTIAGEARAFALDPGRIYLHFQDRYPRGRVQASDKEALLRDLEAVFGSLEFQGEPVIKRMYRAEELYSGDQIYRAPELVLLGQAGYNLRGNMRPSTLFGQDIFTGKHSQEDAFLLVWGNAVPAKYWSDLVTVSDVVPIMDRLRGG